MCVSIVLCLLYVDLRFAGLSEYLPQDKIQLLDLVDRIMKPHAYGDEACVAAAAWGEGQGQVPEVWKKRAKASEKVCLKMAPQFGLQAKGA